MSATKKLLPLMLFLAAAIGTQGQTLTNVTGTITDPNGLPYSYATVTITIQGGGSSPQVTPCPQGPCPVMNTQLSTNVNGAFSVALWANGSITPGGTQWTFNVVEPGIAPPLGYGPQQFSYTVTISGSSQNLSSALSALAPAMSRITGSGGAVSSVFGRTGAVVAENNDYNFNQLAGAVDLATQVSGQLANANLANDSITVNSQSCVLGSSCVIPGTGVTSFNTRTGAVVPANGDYNFSMLSGAVDLATQVSGQLANANLANDSITVNAVPCVLGGSCTVSGTGGANTALSNLASPALNAAPSPGTDNSIAVDDVSHRYTYLYLSDALGFTNGSGTCDTGISRGAANTIDMGDCTPGDHTALVNVGSLSTGAGGGGACGTATGCIALADGSIAAPGATGYSTFRATATGFLCNVEAAGESACTGSGGGANQSLSNLTNPTAVNQSLIPASTSQSLGTGSNPWGGVYSNLLLDVDDGYATYTGAGGTLGTAFTIAGKEGTASSCLANWDLLQYISSAHAIEACYNNGTLEIVPLINGTPNTKQVMISKSATEIGGVDFPSTINSVAANCNNTTPGVGWSIGSGGTPDCRAGTNNQGGYVSITDTSSTFAQFNITIPQDWDSSALPYIRFQIASTDTTSGHTIIPQIKVSCAKGDGSTTDDVTFNAAHSLSTVTLNTTANQFWSTSSVQMNSTDMTGCVAGSMMVIQVGRATDTASDANFYSATLTFPRLITVQAN